ncbi:phosphatase PAP2 family protein [Streptomyces sp. NBC_00963]|uniref:phosphatase PAP2 family protein n=1 Tax=unclassified Streptomyces TaxID=2593676 RepID=UPI00225441E7|nr:phosphatase PAP2 family protein [Streptomyces sp. NBC_01306]MCX4727471.1 phosphatase PAP2 family protein [Streptomyces sp. NBC_01306]WSX41333.1 phosphatase PAP2 family protein [Streptomyces sp. NBC_00963]
MRIDRIFTRLDREPEPPKLEIPRMSRTRIALLGSTLAFYLAIVVAVLSTSWLVGLDWKVMLFRPYQQWPQLHAFLDYFVVLGQRGPTAVMVAAWLGWRSWRQHTLRPLLTLGAALLLLNITVGAVKLGLGRLGPHYATQIGSAELFAGGDIFPSGHTANAVVTWGILAYLATTPLARRWLSVGSAALALGVGATTVYLGTHWLSDVLLGWAAGLLVLLGLPWFEPLIGRTETAIFAVREKLRAARRRPAAPAPIPVDVQPALFPHGQPRAEGSDDESQPLEPVGIAGRSGSTPRSGTHPTSLQRAHGPRSDRTPVTPAGSRRPPHADRTPRTGQTRPVPGGST